MHDEVFGSIRIDKVGQISLSLQQDDRAVRKRLLHPFTPRQSVQLSFDLSREQIGYSTIGSQQYRLTVSPMLGLRQKIGGKESYIGARIGYNHHFRRPCRHIDSYTLHGYLLFSGHYITISWSKNLIYLRNTLRAKSHSTYGLHSSQFKNTVYPCLTSRIQYSGGYLTLLSGRSTHHDFMTTRQTSRDSQHQYRRKKRSCTARHIKTYFFYSHRLLPTPHTGCGFYFFHLDSLRGVELTNVVDSLSYRLFQRLGHSHDPFFHFNRRHLQCIQYNPIELLLITSQRIVSFASYRF